MGRERAKRGTIVYLYCMCTVLVIQRKELRRKHGYVIRDEFCWTSLSVLLAWHPTGRSCEMSRGVGWGGAGGYFIIIIIFIFPLDSASDSTSRVGYSIVLPYRHYFRGSKGVGWGEVEC